MCVGFYFYFGFLSIRMLAFKMKVMVFVNRIFVFSSFAFGSAGGLFAVYLLLFEPSSHSHFHMNYHFQDYFVGKSIPFFYMHFATSSFDTLSF